MKAAMRAAAPATDWAMALAPALEALRGLRLRHLAVAVAAGFFFAILRGFYLVLAYAEGQAVLPKLPGLLLSGIGLVLAVVIADAYVRRGARPILAYGAAVFVSAVVSAIANYYLTLALGGDNFFGPEVPLAVRRTEMLFTSILRMIESGFPVAAYLQWRDREATSARLQTSELRRAQDERHMQQTQLRALQARVEPELLFGALRRAEALTDTQSARADQLLDDVITLLRLLMPRDAGAAERLGPTVADELAIAAAYLRVRDGCDGVTRALEVVIGADAAGIRLQPMLLLPLMRALVGREKTVHAPLEIRAARESGALTLVFARQRDADGGSLLDPADLAALQRRLAESFAAGAANAVADPATHTLTLRLPADHG